MNDILAIDNLAVECILGAYPEERGTPRTVFVTVELAADLSPAARGDALEDAIDYHALSKRIAQIAREGRFHLVETLACALAEECLRDTRVAEAAVTVRKPGVPPGAEGARACVRRSRDPHLRPSV
ncbi:MAG: dihydroneopterin aldolase [Kiritimatiellia bacterium]|jgi:FolB domain-containing protein